MTRAPLRHAILESNGVAQKPRENPKIGPEDAESVDFGENGRPQLGSLVVTSAGSKSIFHRYLTTHITPRELKVVVVQRKGAYSHNASWTHPSTAPAQAHFASEVSAGSSASAPV